MHPLALHCAPSARLTIDGPALLLVRRAVVGLGAVFALATSLMVWLDARYSGVKETSEHFATAGRSINVGLTACDIVSKWTW